MCGTRQHFQGASSPVPLINQLILQIASARNEKVISILARVSRRRLHEIERKKSGALTHAGAILLRLAQLDLFQLLLLCALRTALPARRTLLFQLCVMPREPEVRDELMELG